MKQLLYTVLMLALSYTVSAQPPKYFNYQGIARDSTGNPVIDTISLRISIHSGTTTGTVVYKETFQPVTNEFGSFSINIGSGTVVLGNFSTIPWSRYSFFQEVEMDITGGTNYVSMGTMQYLSVPYALAADSAKVADIAVGGKAPFIIQNNVPGNSINNVAIAGIVTNGPNSAPAVYAKNNGLGSALYAESGNGVYVVLDSTGLETNGKSLFSGPVDMNANLNVSAPVNVSSNVVINGNLNVNGSSASLSNMSTGNASIASLTVTGSSILNGSTNMNGNAYIAGQLSVNSISSVFGMAVNGGTNINSNNSNINGNLNVSGTLSKASGSFKIDHPLDPENKYLYHSFVESPDMKNIYDGTVITDKNGKATISLPAYFGALNKDFRYQLTCVGVFAQAIVFKKIHNNQFLIKTSKPNVEVSWQVTGIRNDSYAKKHRIVPEVEKEENAKGKLLYPDSY